MKAGRLAVFTLLLGCIPFAEAQHRFTSEALVGLDQMHVVVRDLDAAEDVWRSLGFLVKPGKPRANGSEYAQVRFADGSGIELVTAPAAVDDMTTTYVEQLAQAEGPVLLSFHGRDMAAVGAALEGAPAKYGSVSHNFALPSLDYLLMTRDSRESDDAAWLGHRNGATALSRVWIAASRRDGRDLSRVLEALDAEMMGAKIYAPDAVQSTVATLNNGELLIVPEDRQVVSGRRIIGLTFEVESLASLRQRLTSFGVPFTAGGAQEMSVIVAPDVAQGLWIEFRE